MKISIYNNVRLFRLLVHVVSAVMVSAWLILCTLILVTVAGSGSISRNPSLILTMSLVPVILLSAIGNFISSSSIRSIDFNNIDEGYKRFKIEDVSNKLLAAWKITKLSLLYVLFSGLFARIFSGDYILLFIIATLTALLQVSKAVNLKSLGTMLK